MGPLYIDIALRNGWSQPSANVTQPFNLLCEYKSTSIQTKVRKGLTHKFEQGVTGQGSGRTVAPTPLGSMGTGIVGITSGLKKHQK